MSLHAPLVALVLLMQPFGQVPECAQSTGLHPQQQKPCLDPVICDDLAPMETEDHILPADVEAWGHPCRAYALMPEGADHWTAPRGLFAVARAFPMYATGWAGEGPRGEYSPRQALQEGHLGPPVLGWISGAAELWGCGDDRRAEVDLEALEEAGLCLNPIDVQIGSPFWTEPRFFVLLGRCEVPMPVRSKARSALDKGFTAEQWDATGHPVHLLLERLEQVEGYDLVCVTPELAQERRRARAEAVAGESGPLER